MMNDLKFEEVKREDVELLGYVWKIWEEALPKTERPQSQEAVSELLKSEDYHVVAGFSEGIPIFFVAYRTLSKEFLVMEHLAVMKKMRGKGFGSKFMRLYAKQFFEDKKLNIIAEIERPDDYDGSHKKDAERRIKWYESCGFIVHYKNTHKYPHRLDPDKFMYTFLTMYKKDFENDEEFFKVSKLINIKSYGAVVEY